MGEFAAIQILLDNDFIVSREVSDSARYDLITDFHGELKRVQVKTMRTSIDDPNKVYIHREKVTNGKKNAYTKEQIDQIAWLIEDKGYLILVDIEAFGEKKNMIVSLPSPVDPDAAVLTQQPGVRFLLGAPKFTSEDERSLFFACKEFMLNQNGRGAIVNDPDYTKFAERWARDVVLTRTLTGHSQ